MACHLTLVTVSLAMGCATPTPRTARARLSGLDPANPRAFSGWSKTALNQRAMRLERALLRHGPRDPSRVMRRHRLAAVYLALSWREYREAAQYLERAYALRQWWRNSEREQIGRAYRLHTARAKQWKWRAVRQWLEALHTTGSQHYGRIDEVIWSAASVLMDAADTEAQSGWPDQVQRRRYEGFALLERLLRYHPRSRYVGRALLILGEALHKRGLPTEAAVAFRKVLRGPTKSLHAQTHLGLGRCLNDVNRPRRALHHFVLAHQTSGPSIHRGDIRKALFSTWMVTGAANHAHAFCLRVAQGNRATAQTLFVSLATWTGDHGRPGIAADLWQEAHRRWPGDRRQCKWWQAAITATAGLRDWHRTERLLRRVPALLSSFGQKHSARARTTKACRASVERTLKSLATRLHAKVLRQLSLAVINVSRLAYALYERTFPRTRHAYLLDAQHGDLLWFMIQANFRSSGPSWRQVGAHFDRLARRKRPAEMRPERYRRRRLEAALTAVRAWLKAAHWKNRRSGALLPGLAGPRPCLRRGPKRCLRRGPPSLKRRPLPTNIRRLRRALLHFLAVAGPTHYPVAVLHNLGDLHWRHNQFKKALPYLVTVAFKFHKTSPDLARTAAFRAYHVLLAMGRRAPAARLLVRILGHKTLMNDWSFGAKMKRLHAEILWARAVILKRNRRWRRCGRLFARIAKVARTPRTINAHLEAARCYEAAGRYGPVVRVLRRLIQHHRQSSHTPAATLRLARTYQRIGSLKWAAREYERYVDRYPERKDAPAVHLVALRIRTGLGRPYTLATQLKSFLGRYGVTHPNLAARARWLWIRSVRARGQRWRLPGLLRGWLKHHGRTGPAELHLEASVLLATLTWRRSCPVAPTGGRCLAAPAIRTNGGPTRRTLLRRAPKLVRATGRLLARALKRLGGAQTRTWRDRKLAKQATLLKAALSRYHACRRSLTCRSGRVRAKAAAPARPRASGERWRKTTAPVFRTRPSGFDHRALRAPSKHTK